jgi:hypothetical protein
MASKSSSKFRDCPSQYDWCALMKIKFYHLQNKKLFFCY